MFKTIQITLTYVFGYELFLEEVKCLIISAYIEGP